MSLLSTDLMSASSEKTGDGQTSGFAVKRSRRVAVKVDITANPSGTLQFFLETSDDNANWYQAYETPAAGGTGKFIQEYPIHEGFVRLRWTLSGGNATFSAKLTRHE